MVLVPNYLRGWDLKAVLLDYLQILTEAQKRVDKALKQASQLLQHLDTPARVRIYKPGFDSSLDVQDSPRTASIQLTTSD